MHEELKRLCDEDQSDLREQRSGRLERHRLRRKRVLGIINQGGAFDGEDYIRAAVIFQQWTNDRNFLNVEFSIHDVDLRSSSNKNLSGNISGTSDHCIPGHRCYLLHRNAHSELIKPYLSHISTVFQCNLVNVRLLQKIRFVSKCKRFSKGLLMREDCVVGPQSSPESMLKNTTAFYIYVEGLCLLQYCPL